MPDQLTSGIHEKESVASKWTSKFFGAFAKVASENNFLGFDVGDNFFEFVDKEGNIIEIKFKAVMR